jgi:uncharacterized protein
MFTKLQDSVNNRDENVRLVIVRYFLDRAGYGLQQSSARIWRTAPPICRIGDILEFLHEQGIKDSEDETLLAEVYLDKFESYMSLDCLDEGIYFDFSAATRTDPGILNFRLTDLQSGELIQSTAKAESTATGFCTASPVGLFAFSLTIILEVAHIFGKLVNYSVHPSFKLIWGPYAFFVSGLLQVIAGLIEASRNNIYGATAFMTFGCFWLANGTQIILTTYFPDQIPAEYLEAGDPVGNFIRNIYITAFLCVLLKQTFVSSKLSSLLIGVVLVFVFVSAISGWSTAFEWVQVILGTIVSLLAFYVYGAEFTNEVYQEEVFYMHPWSEESSKQIFAAAGTSSSLQSRAAMLRAATSGDGSRKTFHNLRSAQPLPPEE